ncbi:zinc finger protein 652-A [Nilaparvata lugens]|uniref:zinc finger protein 652-A n=1 Tax=Nilaparvata lugens TaxID=108931 RepID=UPI00193C9E9B|nr:zinc finger protein 652-A [Nilaparvata lugens]
MHSILHREKAQLNSTHRLNGNIEDEFNSSTTVFKRKRLVSEEKEAVDQAMEEPIDVDGSDSEAEGEAGRSATNMESDENYNHLPLMLKKSKYLGGERGGSSNMQVNERDNDEDDNDSSTGGTFHGLNRTHSEPENLSNQSCDIYKSGKSICDANLGVFGQNELMMMGSSILSRHLMYLSYLNFLAAYKKAQEQEQEAEQEAEQPMASSHDCSVCSRSFDQKGTLRAHMDSCHKGMRFHCTDCGKKFSSRSCLKLHVDSLHKGLKYDCTVCGKSFTQKGHLNIHVESIHNRVKFDCHMCSRVFSQKSTLKVHVDSVHKGLKYVCSICDESFNWRIQLKQHIGLHHNGVKFTCTICNINLYHKRSLNKHMALFH